MFKTISEPGFEQMELPDKVYARSRATLSKLRKCYSQDDEVQFIPEAYRKNASSKLSDRFERAGRQTIKLKKVLQNLYNDVHAAIQEPSTPHQIRRKQ